MRKLTLVLASLAALASMAAAPAGQFCYDLDVNVNGDAVVDEADCVDTP